MIRLRVFLVSLILVLLVGSLADRSSGLMGQEKGVAEVPQGDVGGNRDLATVEHHTESYLSWFVRSSGLIGVFILALSMYFVATVIRLFLDVRQENAAPPNLISQCNDHLVNRDLPAVYAAFQADDSFLGRVVTTGLAELPMGLPEACSAMDRTGEAETVNLERQISMLAVIGTLGPMIGLIGTLKGMISSFSVIAMSDVQLKASEVASGISEALLLTFEGVALSIPAIYFHAMFRNRVSSISATTMVHAEHFVRRVAQLIRSTKGGPAQSANSPPPVARRETPSSASPRPANMS